MKMFDASREAMGRLTKSHSRSEVLIGRKEVEERRNGLDSFLKKLDKEEEDKSLHFCTPTCKCKVPDGVRWPPCEGISFNKICNPDDCLKCNSSFKTKLEMAEHFCTVELTEKKIKSKKC
jgi:hypothetical protein